MSRTGIDEIGSAVEGRRRRYTAEQKRALLEEAAKPGSSVSETARRYGVSASLLFKWKSAMDDATNKSLQKNERVVPESEVREMRKRIQELERLAGKQAMKIEILEEAVKIGREKKWISLDSLSTKGGGK